MKFKTSTITLSLVSLLWISCIKPNPTPSTSSSSSSNNYGSWSYNGSTYNGTYSSWINNALIATASKPSSSSLEAWFGSNNPSSGSYNLAVSSSSLSSNQVYIALVDGNLPAISYISSTAPGTNISVSNTGGSITVTLSNVKVYGLYSSNGTNKLDSVLVSGTIVH